MRIFYFSSCQAAISLQAGSCRAKGVDYHAALLRMLCLQILLQEGQEAPVGTPAAVVVEEGAQSASTSSSPTASSSSTEGSSQGHSAVPTTNVYDDAQPRVRVLEWQSYLKDGSQGTSSAGCS